MTDTYTEFLEAKVDFDSRTGFDIDLDDIHPALFDHQRLIVQWAVKGGRRAIFAGCGLGKSLMQLETLRQILLREGGRALIVCPLGVRGEFAHDAAMLNIETTFVRRTEQVAGDGIYVTNYESVRDGKLDVDLFTAVSLDEASILRSYGTKTFQTFLPLLTDIKYRFVATATPSPNRYKELIHYSAYLGIMDTGSALAQPLSEPVLTPSGWSAMGDLRPGDQVIGVDGKSTGVLGVYPQGEKQIYRVEFSDGTFTRCTGDHLWLTRTQYERNAARKFVERNPGTTGRLYWTTKTTDEIAASLRCTSTGAKNHQVPLADPVMFDAGPVDVDPYLLGFLLGDGHMRQTSVSFTTADQWIVDHIASAVSDLGLSVRKNPHVRRDGRPNYDYSISAGRAGRTGRGHESNAILSGVRGYGLIGKRAWEKFIPDAYLYNSPDIRLAVLQGLMDADGTVSKTAGTTKFCTTSARLRDGAMFIARSLGGTATVRERVGQKPNGDPGRLQYLVTLRLPNGTVPFRLPRKADLARDREKYPPRRYITAVIPDGTEVAQCIAVEHPERLYLTRGCVVTHNTRFFKRDSTKANNLTLHPHHEHTFWLWLNTWSVFLQSPADIGCDATGYDLPGVATTWHEVDADHSTTQVDRDGVAPLFKGTSMSMVDASREKRDTIAARVAQLDTILADHEQSDTGGQVVIWCDLNAEQSAIERKLGQLGYTYSSVYGGLPDDEVEARLQAWRDRRTRALIGKPVMLGSGMNLQQANVAIFIGITHKFNDFYQAQRRIVRFGQTRRCHIHIIHADSEREVKATLLTKWAQHEELTTNMTDVITEHGLSQTQIADALKRSIGVTRSEASGEGWLLANNDCIPETRAMQDNSVDLIVTSIPFGNHYSYSNTVEDLGYTDDNDHFWAQMDYLTPELLRVLAPGRIYACHVKDRILFGAVTGAGVPTVSPFHMEATFHALKHGFDYLGMITVVTDVVRENNQTYRLGWSEMAKDGTKMGVGSPEYVLLFHKPQSNREKGYADTPVRHDKNEYTRARWQVDAHAYWRSSGDRTLTADELATLGPDQLATLFTEQSLREIYNYQSHVRIGEELDGRGALPATFMSLAPGSWHPDVWHDINRMLTLNGEQSKRNVEQHICLARGSLVLTKGGYKPIQEIVPGELVLTHKGRWRPVLTTQKTGDSEPVVNLRAQGVPGAVMTPDHKVWTRDTRGLRARSVPAAKRREPSWVEASETVDSYVNRKLAQVEPTSTSADVWWMVGRWLADGHIDKRGTAIISVGPAKRDEFEEHLGEFGGNPPREVSALQYPLRDPLRVLRNILKECGQGAAEKRLPAEAYTLPDDEAAALLDGYLSGDGHYLEDRQRWCASSVSKELMLGIAYLAQRVHGAVASVYPGRPEREGEILGRRVHMRQDWILSFSIRGGRKRPFVMADGAWMKVRSAEPAGEVETWNIRVAEDESYHAEGMVVKNCPLQYDIVDRLIERYSNPGELVFDPFAGLGTVPLRAVKAGRRGRGVELNGAYWLDSVKYLEATERDRAMPTLFDIV